MWHLITHKTEIVYSPLHINKMQRISLVIAVAMSGFTAEGVNLSRRSNEHWYIKGTKAWMQEDMDLMTDVYNTVLGGSGDEGGESSGPSRGRVMYCNAKCPWTAEAGLMK